MPTKRYTYKFYKNPIQLKSIFILIAFAILGLSAGLSEGILDLSYPISGVVIGLLCIAVSSQIRTSYTLHDEKVTVAINFRETPFLTESAEYSNIAGIEWESDPPYNIGYNAIGDFESHHYNLGGEHIRIKKESGKDITFSATKQDLNKLQDTLEA